MMTRSGPVGSSASLRTATRSSTTTRLRRLASSSRASASWNRHGHYQASLAEFPTLDLIPAAWLHLTVQGIGFVDEVTDVEFSRLTDLVQRRLGALTPPTVTFHRPVVRPEAVYLPADPPEPVRSLRDVVRHAVAEVLGDDRVDQPVRPPGEYRPHVSLAYSNAEQDAEPIAKALSEVHAEPVSLTLGHVDLLTFHRDRRMYEWTRAIPLPIGGGGSTRV
ncbi:2'-5' RNA ligase family protein [Micromonospora sp. NPDC047548]|uniref:2'-5' RNA ligase family protein n=1 Tax=Micromonospora sp. NPDC047548 TaxID=3155624 RepID=UPI0033E23D67